MTTAFLSTLFQHKAWCNRGLVEALRAAPADADRRQMAVILFTLDHTAIVDQIFKAHLSGAAPGFTGVVAGKMPDLDALSRTLAETDAWYLDYVGRVSPAELETEVAFTFVDDGSPGRMTKGEMLAHVITHGASHRGAIGKMLEGLGVRGASDMVTTFHREGRLPAA
jgi:uncharacterized damage-inducible protein DinB